MLFIVCNLLLRPSPGFDCRRAHWDGLMETVVIVIHLMVVLALVGVVLLQRSEGGALGVGGGGGGLMSSRGTANVLTRATAILAGLFFLTSLTLAILARTGTEKPGSILDKVPAPQATEGEKPALPPSQGGLLEQLEKSKTTPPATPAPAATEAPKPTEPVKAPEAPKAEAPAPAATEAPKPVEPVKAPEAPKAEAPAPAATEAPKPAQ